MLIVFGGSFNPPTKAHLELVERIKNIYQEAKIIIVPVSNKNYTWKHNLASDIDRFNMLKIQFPNILISDYEFRQKNYKGTYELLKYFKKYDNDIYFLIGSDNLAQMPLWLNFDKLIKEFKFIVVKRPTDKIDFKEVGEYKKNFYEVEMESNISSTKVREDVFKYKDYLLEDIFKYIIDKHLYEVKKC